MPGKRPALPKEALAELALPPVRPARIDVLPAGADRPLPGLDRVTLVPLADLWLEHQPREIVPEEQLQQLIAEGRAQPGALLEALRWSAAADAYYATVLAGLEALARSVASEGVLQPIQVVRKGDRLVVRDGHRRCLASLLAERPSIPALVVEEPSELASIAHPLIVNLQREDLTALEKAAALLRLALAVGRYLAVEQGHDPGVVTIPALVGSDEGVLPGTDDGAATGSATIVADRRAGEGSDASATIVAETSSSGLPRGLRLAIEQRCCEMAGLSRSYFQYHLNLARLTPEARALGRGLTEGRLRPITALPPSRQAEILAFAQAQSLSTEGLKTLCSAVRRGDEDEVQRIMARLRKERQAPRATPSWHRLLYAIPADYGPLVAALDAEIGALSGREQQARLEETERTIALMEGAAAALRALVARRKQASTRR